MDEKTILLMSEELRAAMSEKARASVEEEAPVGRWARVSSPALPDAAQSYEVHIAARVLRCAAIRGGKVRLSFALLDGSSASHLAALVDRSGSVRIVAGSDLLQVSLLGRVKSVRISAGDQHRVSVLVEPTS
jgi:hypothetical protein